MFPCICLSTQRPRAERTANGQSQDTYWPHFPSRQYQGPEQRAHFHSGRASQEQKTPSCSLCGSIPAHTKTSPGPLGRAEEAHHLRMNWGAPHVGQEAGPGSQPDAEAEATWGSEGWEDGVLTHHHHTSQSARVLQEEGLNSCYTPHTRTRPGVDLKQLINSSIHGKLCKQKNILNAPK